MLHASITTDGRATRPGLAAALAGAALLLAPAAFAQSLAPFARAPAPAVVQGTQQGAPADKFHITAQEKAACTSDAIRFCTHTYPDEDMLLACMKQNREALSAVCRVAFDAGVRRRRL